MGGGLGKRDLPVPLGWARLAILSGASCMADPNLTMGSACMAGWCANYPKRVKAPDQKQLEKELRFPKSNFW